MSKRMSIIIFTLLIFISCSSKYSKDHYLATIKLGNGFYEEIFKTYSGGALASDSYSHYVTDSINFRQLVGHSIYDDQQIRCQVKNAEILVFLINRHKISDTLEKNSFNINELIKRHKFE